MCDNNLETNSMTLKTITESRWVCLRDKQFIKSFFFLPVLISSKSEAVNYPNVQTDHDHQPFNARLHASNMLRACAKFTQSFYLKIQNLTYLLNLNLCCLNFFFYIISPFFHYYLMRYEIKRNFFLLDLFELVRFNFYEYFCS